MGAPYPSRFFLEIGSFKSGNGLIMMLYESIWEDYVMNEQGPVGASQLSASSVGVAGSRVPACRSDPSQRLFL